VFLRAAVALTAVALVAACGSSPAGNGTAVSTATTTTPVVSSVPSTTVNVSVTVTASDNGRVFAVAPGQVVAVSLSTGELWTEPMPSDPTVLRRHDGAVNPTTGAATATFSAAAPGSTRVTSSRRCRPVPGKLCAMYVALWSVTITVS
jgi:hypothetical protein